MAPPPVHSRRTELRELWKLAVPLSAAQVGHALMGFVDTAILTRAGLAEMSAVAMSNLVLFVLISLGAGLIMGLDPQVAQSFGAGNESRARTLLWQGSHLAVGLGLVFAVGLTFGVHLLPLLGVHFVELPQFQEYLLWRAPGLPLLLLFFTTRAYLQGVGHTRVLVVSTVVANVVNLVVASLLVFGGAGLPEFCGPLRAVPALGIKGAALATTLCCGLQWLITTRAVRRIPVPGQPPLRRPQWAYLKPTLKLGIPISVMIIAEEGIYAVSMMLARGLGPESVSAFQIAMSYSLFTYSVISGIGNASCVRVGWALGAGNPQQVRQSGQVALASGAAFMGLGALVFAAFPYPLIRLMGAPPEVATLLVPMMMVTALFQFSDGVLGVAAGVLRGMGDTRFTSAAVTSAHYLVGLPMALFLGYGLDFGVVGLWGGLCAGLTAMALALCWRFERLSSNALQPLQA